MKSIQDFEDEIFLQNSNRKTSILALKVFRDKICSKCKKNKELQKAWAVIVKKMLYDKRSSDK